MKINNISVEEVFVRLVTSEDGLSEAEAVKRSREFGPNEIREMRKRPLYLKLLDQLTHFLAVLLWIGAGLAFVSEYLAPGEGMFRLGVAIVAVIVINAAFSFLQEYRAEKSIEKLRLLLPFLVTVVREGRQKEVHARDIVPGDIIVLAEGAKVPADSRIIESAYLMVNNAPLTGESEPVALSREPFEGELLESRNIAFAGSTVVSGRGKAVIFASGMRTEFGRIAHLTSAIEPGLSPLQKEIVKSTRVIAFIAFCVGIIFFCLGFLIGRSFWDNFIFAIGITVALIPEGMLPTVTLSLAMGSQRMAKKNALMKTLTSVETLGSVTVVCTDKTGTLTQNRMEVRKVFTEGKVIDPEDLSENSARHVLLAAYHCNNAVFSGGRYTGDPTETALLKQSREILGDSVSRRLYEIPFDSERKRMTTVNMVNGKTYVFSKGAIENLLPLCSRILEGGVEVTMDDDRREQVVRACHSLMDEGLRVLVFSYSQMDPPDMSSFAPQALESSMVFSGLVGLEDPPRPEVRGAIEKCGTAGIKVIMITGDSSRTARAIAREIGLAKESPVLIEGHDLEKMNDQDLRGRIGNKEVIFARMTPKHKMRVVSILKAEGEVVAVTGDGVNDAPALRKADIGIAMGISGTDVAKEAADMVLLDDNFASIVDAVEEGRTVYDNIKKFLTYIIASNIPEAVPYLAFIILRIPLPLTILQILAIDLGTDMLPALALGTEKPTPGIMKRSPRRPDERMLDLPLIIRAYLFLGPIEAVACMFGFFWVLYQGGWSWGQLMPETDLLYRQATTACLTAIIIAQMANVFACRSSSEPLFKLRLFSNGLIFIGLGVELLLQLFIVYHPWGNRIFSTSPLTVYTWLVLLPFAFLLLFADETRKLISARANRCRQG